MLLHSKRLLLGILPLLAAASARAEAHAPATTPLPQGHEAAATGPATNPAPPAGPSGQPATPEAAQERPGAPSASEAKPAAQPATLVLQPAAPVEGTPVTVRLTWPGPASRMRLRYRSPGAKAFVEEITPALEDGAFEAVIPGTRVHPPAIEYGIDLLDAKGHPRAVAGPAGSPLHFRVAAAKVRSTPVYDRPWFWVTMGFVAAAVSGGAVGLGVGLTR